MTEYRTMRGWPPSLPEDEKRRRELLKLQGDEKIMARQRRYEDHMRELDERRKANAKAPEAG